MIATYDPKEVILSVLGIDITGYAAGTFVNVEMDEDTFTMLVGAGGDTARVRNQNSSATVTITLMQTSPANDALSAAYNLDKQTGNGVGPFQLKDNRGTTNVNAQNCWVKKPAAIGFGKELEDRVWTLQLDKLEGNIGGTVKA